MATWLKLKQIFSNLQYNVGVRILIVEDEPKLAQALRRAMELQALAVDVVHDGAEGFDLASSEQYDAIVLDVMLPSMDGFTICRQLRAEHITTPILMLTARGQLQDKVSGLDAGADDYLVKPFAIEELFSRLRALIRRSSYDREPALKASDLQLDPVTLKVTRSGQSINLSAKEFAVLEYLLRHKNQVVTKDQLVSHVWNYDADILPNTVEVHVKNLRDKVDKKFAKQLIHTKRGFGYELTDES